jgi:hypothetical protein
MTRRGFVIGPYRFVTKKEATERVREVLNMSPLGSFLQGNEFNLVRWLLNMHSEVDIKVGPGVVAISVDRNTMGSRGFWLHRADSSVVDFSYRHCLNGKPNHRQEILAAMRWEVDPQIFKFRDWVFATQADDQGRVKCPLTGLLVTRSESNVDHAVRFVDMADYFVKCVGGYDGIEYECAETGARGWLKDRQLGEAWQTWHEKYAQLRVV